MMTFFALRFIASGATTLDNNALMTVVVGGLLSGGIIQFLLQHLLTKATRESTRRKMEEETTDAIIARVNSELERAYAIIDHRDRRIRRYERWLRQNKEKFKELGINSFPEEWDSDSFEEPQLIPKL